MRTIHTTIFLCVALVACNGTGSTDGVQLLGNDTSGLDLGRADTAESGGADAHLPDEGTAVTDAGDPSDDGTTPGIDMPAESDVSASDMVDMRPTFASAGCESGGGLPEGEASFTLENRTRRYILRLPQNYDPARPWPVVLALHGNGGNTGYWDGTSGSRNIRGVLANEAILVVVEAIEGNWRDYNADPSTWPARIESELAYFDSILDEVRTELCVDESAIFSMGFSGGGSFSGVLACRRTDIRAIAVGGSVIYFDPDNCIGRSAAWITIGTEELTTGREQYRDFFRDRAGCEATSMAAQPSPCVSYDGCDDGTPVHYCQHPDGHIWPDFGSDAMWGFFGQFVSPQP